jgi:hypothetical protein
MFWSAADGSAEFSKDAIARSVAHEFSPCRRIQKFHPDRTRRGVYAIHAAQLHLNPSAEAFGSLDGDAGNVAGAAQQKPARSGRLPAGFVSMLMIGIGSSTTRPPSPCRPIALRGRAGSLVTGRSGNNEIGGRRDDSWHLSPCSS